MSKDSFISRSALQIQLSSLSSDPGHEERESAQLKLLGEPDENAFGPAHVAQPVCVLVLDDVLADQLRTSLRQPFDGVVDVVNREHHSEVAESVDRRVPVIGDNLRREKPRQFKPAMTVRVRIMAISTRWSPSPVTRPAHSPSTKP